MYTDKLVPNIDRRLSSWISIQDRIKSEPTGEKKPTITLSRRFGSEAYPLAEILKELLEKKTGTVWTIFDKYLIEKVTQESGLSERLLGSFDIASKAIDALATMIPGLITHGDAFKVLARFILQIAMEGNAIIIGRGGAVLTQHLPHCFHFRLEAPLEYRINSIQKRVGSTYEEAKKLVIEREKSKDRFIESHLNRSMQDPLLYHAVFNVSKNSLPKIAQSIMYLVLEK
jgi:hypothetical protein